MKYTRVDYRFVPLTLSVCRPNSRGGTTAQVYALGWPGWRHLDTNMLQRIYSVCVTHNM